MTELVSGEAVVLDIPCAQYPSRMGALLLDMLVQIVALVVLLGVLFGFSLVPTGDPAVVTAVATVCYVFAIVGYPTVFETLSRGQTLGKMVFGLRVVSDDGGPVRFRQALVRGLTGAVEIWSIVGAPIGLFLSIVSAKGKRLGDMFAGTYVIQERMPRRPALTPAFAAVPPQLAAWARVAVTAGLSDQTAEAASGYLRRYYQLTDRARADIGLQLASAALAQVSPPPPPGTPPADYLSAVLAVRRHQAAARLAAQQRLIAEVERSPAPWGTPPPAPDPAAQPAFWAMPGTPTTTVPQPPGPYPQPAPGQFPLTPPGPYPPLAPGQSSAAGQSPAGPVPASAWTASGQPEPASPGYGFAPPG